MEKHIASVMVVASIFGFFVPGIRDVFMKQVAVPVGAIFLTVILLGMCWVRVRELKNETMPAPKPEAVLKTEFEEFPEHGVLYALEYPAGKDDVASSLRISKPRCLDHRVSMINSCTRGTFNRFAPVTWQCDGCGRVLTDEENRHLRVLAQERLIKRLTAKESREVSEGVA